MLDEKCDFFACNYILCNGVWNDFPTEDEK
jgi:hypothetical protein